MEKTINIRLTWVILVVITLLGGVWYLGGIRARREADRATQAMYDAQTQLKEGVDKYKVYIDGLDMTIATQKRIMMTQSQAMKGHILDKEKLKAANIRLVKENIVLKAKLEATQDSLDMVEPEVVYVKDSSGVDVPHLRLPHAFNYNDRWLDLTFNIHDNLTWGFDLSSNVDADVIVGETKTGFLKREPTVTILTDNPYFNVINVQSVSIKEEPFFFETKLFRVLTNIGTFSLGFWLGGK